MHAGGGNVLNVQRTVKQRIQEKQLTTHTNLKQCDCVFPAGGGNVLNVQRTVKQLINVGAKGCFLEDQRWPKRVGHMRNKEVISMEEFAGKVNRLKHVNMDTICSNLW